MLGIARVGLRLVVGGWLLWRVSRVLERVLVCRRTG